MERPLPPSAVPAALTLGEVRLEFGGRPLVMGVLNVTPDSFSDGGAFSSAEAAVARGLELLAQGADLLDVGGESSRPGAQPVSVEEELQRVVPVVAGLVRAAPGAVLSVDTRKPQVAAAALEAGARLVNDITALASDEMASAVRDFGAAACLMHMQGAPRTMQEAPHYGDVVSEVVDALHAAVRSAEKRGLPRHRLLVDPGIGFGKTAAHNWALLRHLSAFRALGLPVVVGVSRKSFLGLLTGRPPRERDLPSAVLAALCAQRGSVDVVRVHDVPGTVDALKVVQALVGAG